MVVTRIIAQCPQSDTSKDSFAVQLASTIVGVRKIKLLAAVIPNTNMNVEEGRCDQLTIRIGANTEVLTIPYGNYNFYELAAAIVAAALRVFPDSAFALVYNESRFTCTAGASLEFSILPGPRSLAHLLGFVSLPTAFATQHTGSSAVRLNANRWITLSLNTPGLDVLQVPNINATSTFLLPTYASATEISYLNQNEIGDQAIHLSSGIDLARIEFTLKRIDSNRPFQLSSDTSFLLEFEHDS